MINYRKIDTKIFTVIRARNDISADSVQYIKSNQKQPSCKKRCGPQKGHREKRCEIQGGGQEMAVMVG